MVFYRLLYCKIALVLCGFVILNVSLLILSFPQERFWEQCIFKYLRAEPEDHYFLLVSKLGWNWRAEWKKGCLCAFVTFLLLTVKFIYIVSCALNFHHWADKYTCRSMSPIICLLGPWYWLEWFWNQNCNKMVEYALLSLVCTSKASTDGSTRMLISLWKRPWHKHKQKYKDQNFSFSCACIAFVFTWHKALMLVLVLVLAPVLASLVKTRL